MAKLLDTKPVSREPWYVYIPVVEDKPRVDWDGIVIILGCVAFGFLTLFGARS